MKRTGAAAGEADEGAPLLSPDPAAVAGRRRQTTRMLQAMTACYAVGWMLVRQTTDQMWLVLTEGDTARTAILRGRLDSASQLVAFVAVPIIAGCSDAFGRRVVFMAGSWLLLVVNGLVLLAPPGPVGATFLASREVLLPIAMNLVNIPRLAALGDMYSSDTVALSEVTAFDSSIFPMTKIFVPIIGGVLAARMGLRWPFYCSTVCMAVQALLSLRMCETLPKESRARLNWRHTSPFGFLALFARGRTMATLAGMAMLSALNETGGQPTAAENVANLHKARMLGWGVPERARYESINSIVRVSGLKLVGPMLRGLGLGRAISLSLMLYAAQTGFLAQSRHAWQFYLVLPSFVLNILRSQSLKTALVREASHAGFGQGELQGMLQNLTTVTSVLSPLLWSNLYAYGVRSGREGLFYWAVTTMTLAQVGLSRLLPAELSLSATPG